MMKVEPSSLKQSGSRRTETLLGIFGIQILTRFLAVHTVLSESAGVRLLALSFPVLSRPTICCANQELRRRYKGRGAL
jgi:hypothetical protein